MNSREAFDIMTTDKLRAVATGKTDNPVAKFVATGVKLEQAGAPAINPSTV